MSSLSGNVLVVDDDSGFRQRLTRMLRAAGCHVTTASSAAEALNQLAAAHIDLIFLDTVMPGKDGLRLLKDLRASGRGMPVIMVSDFRDNPEPIVSQAVNLSLQGFLYKTTETNQPQPDEYFLAPARALLVQASIDRQKFEMVLSMSSQAAHYIQLQTRHLVDLPVTEVNRYLTRGELVLDLIGRKAYRGNTLMPLTSTTFEYMAVLARRAPAVVDYVTLVEEAQGYQIGRTEAQELCKYHIHELRQAIEPVQSKPTLILNHRGLGYSLTWAPGEASARATATKQPASSLGTISLAAEAVPLDEQTPLRAQFEAADRMNA